MNNPIKKAVSVSLGKPERDKKVQVKLNGVPLILERIGTGGDAQAARQLFTRLDGKVDALSVGGVDLYVRIGSRDYPIRAALKMIKEVHQTPVVDGRLLKYVLESRVFELAAVTAQKIPHFRRAFVPFGTDRIGLIKAVSEVADEVVIGDLMFMFGLPFPVYGLDNFLRLARLLLPVAGFLPISILNPPGAKDKTPHPKYEEFWHSADLIAGDMHYIYKYSPEDLQGKFVVTNTTTDENLELLRRRGVSTVITTTPRYEGRSFGVNLMEAALVAYSGEKRTLSMDELNKLIEEIKIKPSIQKLTD
ncbi:MAG: quinate 5-dehydrogenase [Anaerolineales bacterium]